MKFPGACIILPAVRKTAKTATLDHDRQIELPHSIFGPFRHLEAIPWLMLATAIRVFVNNPPPAMQVLITIVSSLAVFLAFRIMAQRLIEYTNCPARLGYLGSTEQLKLALDIVGRFFLASFIGAVVLVLAGNGDAFFLFLALDGMSFDQDSVTVIVWSSVSAAVILLMLLGAERTGSTAIRGALKELAWHGIWLAPAISFVAVFLIGLDVIQDWVRSLVAMYWQTGPTWFAKAFVYFMFVFGFATFRLWVVTAILVSALRLSYRYNIGPSDPDTVGQK